MKKAIAAMLCVFLLLSLCACGQKETATEHPTGPVDTFNYPTIHQKLTWDAINAFPVKTEDMTVAQMRDLCVDFFRFTKTALWTPNQNWNFVRSNSGQTDDIYKGAVYGGLPYIPVASGNIYRLMDYINQETGVVDMTEPMKNPKLFGNQCSIGAYWGWARVINSAKYLWTSGMVQQNGFLRVGPYTYDDKLTHFESGVYTTSQVIKENGIQIMCQSYGAMQHADGLVTFNDGGHTMMCSADPVVVYAPDGTIDASQSYLYIIDQHVGWSEATNEAGDTYQHKNYVDRKFTFLQLIEEAYLPFTFAEFLGTDPIEPTLCSFSHTGDSITVKQLAVGKVSANYGISDIYAVLKDSQGKEILRSVKRAETAGTAEMDFVKAVDLAAWAQYANGKYTVEVFCQLGTGERPSLYIGTVEN